MRLSQSSYSAPRTADRARYRYVVNHLYGDKPLDYVMEIMEQVMKDNPDISLADRQALRLSADHCGFYPRREQLPQMKRLGIMISCGAGTLTSSYPYLKVYGEDKVSNISPIRGALDAGVMTTLEVEGLDFRQARVPPPYMGATALIGRSLGSCALLRHCPVWNPRELSLRSATACEAGHSVWWISCSPEANELPPNHSNRQPYDDICQ